MANGMKITWGYIHSLLSAASAAGISDAALLQRYIEGRDESAFTELVRRHGPMVRGVCRRVLPSPQDAEDAFQATFLVLMNKAAAIRKRGSLACWLHGVALRVAVRLLRNNQHRHVQPLPPEGVPQPERDEVSWREVKRLVDEELARLPERYRMPLILCYLEGKTREEAAAELGWRLPAFRGRLERGRQRLRLRLERRGLALSAALLATLTAPSAEAAIPTTISTAASSQVATLATEVMRTMMLIKLKMAGLCCLAVLSVGIGVTATGYRMVQVEAGPPPEAAGPPQAPPVQRPDRQDEQPLRAEANPGPLVAVLGPKKFYFSSLLVRVAYSPDGKLLAVERTRHHSSVRRGHEEGAAHMGRVRRLRHQDAGFLPRQQGSGHRRPSAHIPQWDVATGKIIREFAGHRERELVRHVLARRQAAGHGWQ